MDRPYMGPLCFLLLMIEKVHYLKSFGPPKKTIKVESRIENLINNNNIKPYNLAAEIKDILISTE